MWNRSYTASWGDVYTHFLFWASFFLEYFFENPAQKRINLAFLSTFLSKFIPFEQFIPFLSTFLSTFLSNIQQKNFFEHFFEYSKKYSKCWVLFWVLFWELFWGFFWDFYYDKTYLTQTTYKANCTFPFLDKDLSGLLSKVASGKNNFSKFSNW